MSGEKPTVRPAGSAFALPSDVATTTTKTSSGPGGTFTSTATTSGSVPAGGGGGGGGGGGATIEMSQYGVASDEPEVALDEVGTGNNNNTYYYSPLSYDESGGYVPRPKGELVSAFPHGRAYLTPFLGVDTFVQWFKPGFNFLLYFIVELLASVIYSFVLAYATFLFPGAFVLFLIPRCLLIAGARYIVVLNWSEWTGATLDLWLMLLFGFDEVLFGRRFPPGANRLSTRISVLGKMLFFGLAQFGGTLIGVALLAVISGNPVKTSDCTTFFADSCNLRPVLIGIGEPQGEWASFLGDLLIMGSYICAWGLTKKMALWLPMPVPYGEPRPRASASEPELLSAMMEFETLSPEEKAARGSKAAGRTYTFVELGDDRWHEVARTAAVGDFLANLMFSGTNGTFGNFWFWLVTDAYTSDYSGSSHYAWQNFVAGGTIFSVQLLVWLIAMGSLSYRKSVAEHQHLD